MSQQEQIQKNASTTVANTQNSSESLQTRPFAPVTKSHTASGEQGTQTNLQAKGDRAAGFGHSFGNLAVSPATRSVIQPKLTIGQPGDKYEREADSVAAQVVQRINQPKAVSPKQGQTVQRMEVPEEEELQMKPLLQRQANTDTTAPDNIETSINQARGGGQSLDTNIQEKMEQEFGADFSGVRVHTDSRSNQLNHSIQAKAFTTGQDIFFRQGAYNPENMQGQELLAHELTHVVQQKPQMVQRDDEPKQEKGGNPQAEKKDAEPVNAAAVDLNQLALDPLSFLKNQCQGEWEKARQYYRQEKITKETMLSLVNFRGQMVGDKSELVKQVVQKTSEYVTNKNKNLEKQHGLKDGSLGEPKSVKFSAPGSQSPTSDIDYNLKGDGTEFAVKIFNELFKKEFGYEAGTFFDVNVYSKDFLPDVFSAGNDVGVKKSTAKKNQELLDKFNNPEKREKLSPQDTEKAKKLSSEQGQGKDLTKPRAGKGSKEFELQGGFDAMDIIGQEIYSLVKMQMYMSIEEWQIYRKNAVEGLGEESTIKKEIEQKFDYAEVKYRKYLEVIVQGIDNSIPKEGLKKLSIAELKKKRKEAEHNEFDKTLAAHNRAYEAKLLEIEELRNEIKVINVQILQNPKNVEQLQVQAQMLAQTVKAMINESLTYANEAYLTEGGVAHVVGTKQIKANLTFSADQYVQAFNENIGDAFKELTRHETDGHGYAAVKAGKYIHRAANEAKHYGQQANEDVQNLDPNRKMNQLGKELETVKNAGKASEANDIGLGIVKKNLNIDQPTTNHVKQELQGFAKRVTQSYNKKKHS